MGLGSTRSTCKRVLSAPLGTTVPTGCGGQSAHLVTIALRLGHQSPSHALRGIGALALHKTSVPKTRGPMLCRGSRGTANACPVTVALRAAYAQSALWTTGALGRGVQWCVLLIAWRFNCHRALQTVTADQGFITPIIARTRAASMGGVGWIHTSVKSVLACRVIVRAGLAFTRRQPRSVLCVQRAITVLGANILPQRRHTGGQDTQLKRVRNTQSQ